MEFQKYEALGNDYLVLWPEQCPNFDAALARRLCDRHYGPGGDGVLYGPLPGNDADFGLRIYNPDGSEAEKSGNGLRIFARALWEAKLVTEAPFTVQTSGGRVEIQMLDGGAASRVVMGRASFDSLAVPVSGARREVLWESVAIGGRTVLINAVSMGNPHCVVLNEPVSAAVVQSLGPLLEKASLFPQRCNVQLLEVVDRKQIRIEIWERGAGYTLASGSSSCAAAAVAHRLGLVDSAVTVHMPGGSLAVRFDLDWTTHLTGPAAPVFKGIIAADTLATWRTADARDTQGDA